MIEMYEGRVEKVKQPCLLLWLSLLILMGMLAERGNNHWLNGDEHGHGLNGIH